MNESRWLTSTTAASGYSANGLLLPMTAAYCCLLAVGMAGNAWVAYVICCVMRHTRRETPRCVQIYILALCLGGLVILLFSTLLICDLVNGGWPIDSPFLCRLYLSSESLSKFYVPFLLTAFSYFCYAKVCRLHRRRRRKRLLVLGGFELLLRLDGSGAAVLSAAACAVLAFLLCWPVYAYGDMHLLVFDVLENLTENLTGAVLVEPIVLRKCAFSPPDPLLAAFTIYSFALGYALPATLFTFFYSAISRRSRRTMFANRAGGRSQFWRVTKTAFCLVSFYLLCWTPYWVLNVINAWTPDDGGGAYAAQPADARQAAETRLELEPEGGGDFSVLMVYLVHILPYVSCTGYPILYTILNRKIIDDYRAARSAKQRPPSCACHQDLSVEWSPTARRSPTVVHPGERLTVDTFCSNLSHSDLSSLPKLQPSPQRSTTAADSTSSF